MLAPLLDALLPLLASEIPEATGPRRINPPPPRPRAMPCPPVVVVVRGGEGVDQTPPPPEGPDRWGQ